VPLVVWVSALAVASSIPVLVWALASGERASSAAVRRNLGIGSGDLRRARLDRPLPERVLLPLLERAARTGGALLPAGRLHALERLLALAGVTGRWTAEQVMGAKVVLGAVLAFGGVLAVLPRPTLLGLVSAMLVVTVGFLLPDVVLRRLAAGRQRQMERDLPDVLDQLTISVEAGLGFEAALQRVVQSTPGPLCEEFGRMLQDVQVGTRRAVALENIIDRTDAPDLRHVVTSLIQSERLGVPLARTLRSQSKEMRLKRRMKAEETANKVAVKLLFPVVFCLFPALFIVILGPAAMRISESF
jgi:tight adherence protein C